MEIKIEQLKEFAPNITQELNVLLKQLKPESEVLENGDVKRVIEDHSVRLLVAKNPDNEIIGMLILATFSTFLPKKGFLEELVVDKNYQGKGIGKKLVEMAIKLAREDGIVHLELTSNPKRVAANNLYQHLGFEKRDTNVYRIKL
jgi:ribosomal protein S18 acetylase RimI-like enzyme